MHAHQILTSAKAILGNDTTGEHSADQVTCPACQAFWTHLATTPTNDGSDGTRALATLAADLPDAPCPSDTCVPCDGCRFEVDLAMATIALGSAGVDPELVWGPGHTSDTAHDPDAWTECPACSHWTTQRADARATLTSAGIDPTRWLGPDDTPN